MSTEIKIVNAEALVVGPDEILIVKIAEPLVESEVIQSFADELDRLGLTDRAIVIAGDVELAKVKR